MSDTRSTTVECPRCGWSAEWPGIVESAADTACRSCELPGRRLVLGWDTIPLRWAQEPMRR